MSRPSSAPPRLPRKADAPERHVRTLLRSRLHGPGAQRAERRHFGHVEERREHQQPELLPRIRRVREPGRGSDAPGRGVARAPGAERPAGHRLASQPAGHLPDQPHLLGLLPAGLSPAGPGRPRTVADRRLRLQQLDDGCERAWRGARQFHERLRGAGGAAVRQRNAGGPDRPGDDAHPDLPVRRQEPFPGSGGHRLPGLERRQKRQYASRPDCRAQRADRGRGGQFPRVGRRPSRQPRGGP